jgi:uncharacterized membrane protein YphA (DoxX/SURF4 family)
MSIPIFINMLVAIWKVHLPHALFGDEGFELALAALALAFSLVLLGPGAISVDHLLSFWLFRRAHDS